MTKAEFLTALERRLLQLPELERRRQLDYFAEMIDDRVEEGTEETEAVAGLGDPSAAADRILQETSLPVLVSSRMRPKGGWTGLTVVLLVLGFPLWLPLMLALFAVMLSVYVVLWSVILVLFAVVLAIGAAGLGLLLAAAVAFSTAVPPSLMLIGGGLVCLGLCVFAFFGALAVARGLARLTAVFARWVKSLFIRKEESL
jgi:uncharacterized membrane protein